MMNVGSINDLGVYPYAETDSRANVQNLPCSDDQKKTVLTNNLRLCLLVDGYNTFLNPSQWLDSQNTLQRSVSEQIFCSTIIPETRLPDRKAYTIDAPGKFLDLPDPPSVLETSHEHQRLSIKQRFGELVYNNIDGNLLANAARLGVHLAAPDQLYQPALGSSPQEEMAIFRELLKPFQSLPKEQRQKAVLLLIQDRLHELFSHNDIDECSKDTFISPYDILAGNGEITSEEYSIMAEFYSEIAQQEGMLSNAADFRIVVLSDACQSSSPHADTLFIYDHKGLSDIPPQRYVLDIGNNDKLVTLKEYLDKRGYALGQNDEELFDYSHSQLVRDGSKGQKFMTEQWLQQINDEDSIAQSISKADVMNIQQSHISFYGAPSLPSEYDHELYKANVNAMELTRLLGATDGVITEGQVATAKAEGFNFFGTLENMGCKFFPLQGVEECIEVTPILPQEAGLMIGRYSESLGRELTIDDMSLPSDQVVRLLGAYSPVLKRPFTETDLNLPDGTAASDNPVVTPAIPALIDDDNGFESVAGLLQNLGVNPGDPVKTAAMFGSDVLGAAAESLVLTLLAKMRLDKIKRRQECLAMLKPMQEKWSSEKGCADLSDKVAKRDFKDLIYLSYFFGGEAGSQTLPVGENNEKGEQRIDQRVGHLLRAEKEYITPERLKQICELVIEMFDDDADDLMAGKRLIKEVVGKDNVDWFHDKKMINKVKKGLDHFGIKLNFRMDKPFVKSAKPICHRTKIDQNKLYGLLEKHKSLPTNQMVVNTLDQYGQNIDALAKVDGYDKQKIKHYKKDYRLRLWAALGSMVPLIPVSDALKSHVYKRASQYRQQNLSIAERRIAKTIDKIDTLHSCQKDKDKLQEKLVGARGLKGQHLTIKRRHDQTHLGIHAISALASPVSLLGPVASLSKSGIRAAAKIFTSSGAVGLRYNLDKKLQQENSYVTVMDIYDLYKQLYQSAKEAGDQQQVDVILELVNASFGVPGDSFEELMRTGWVENKRFKLSLSHKDDLAG